MTIVSKCYFSIHDDGIKMLPPIPVDGIKMLLHNLCRWYQNATSHPYRWYQNATSQYMSMVSKCYLPSLSIVSKCYLPLLSRASKCCQLQPENLLTEHASFYNSLQVHLQVCQEKGLQLDVLDATKLDWNFVDNDFGRVKQINRVHLIGSGNSSSATNSKNILVEQDYVHNGLS